MCVGDNSQFLTVSQLRAEESAYIVVITDNVVFIWVFSGGVIISEAQRKNFLERSEAAIAQKRLRLLWPRKITSTVLSTV